MSRLLIVILTLVSLGFVTEAYGYSSACSQYGVMAMEDFSGNCTCMSGYVFQDSYLGSTCVSANSVCHDEYGYNSSYNSLYNKCECSYGYVMGEDSIGRTQCITDDKSCQNQYGYNAEASYGGKCECRYSYAFDKDIFGDLQCVDGDQMCHGNHGYNSSYDNISNECECDDGYTADDNNQCIEKHNSAYFTLLDISEDGDELLIQSQHNFQNYIIEYGIGCWDYTIESYERSKLVINMGTDFSVDMFDTLVLPNHDQNCSIMGVESTHDDSFPEPEEEVSNWYVPPAQKYTPISERPFTPAENSVVTLLPVVSDSIEKDEQVVIEDAPSVIPVELQSSTTLDSSGEVNEIPINNATDTRMGDKPSLLTKIVNFFKNLF